MTLTVKLLFIREKNTRSLVVYMNREREIHEVINKHVNQKCRSRCYQHPPTLDSPNKLPCPAKLFIGPTSTDYTQMPIKLTPWLSGLAVSGLSRTS